MLNKLNKLLPVKETLEIQGYLLSSPHPLKKKYLKVDIEKVGVSRRIYVNIDSPNLGFPDMFFLKFSLNQT